MKKLRVGILGCAKIATRSLIPSFAAHSRFVVDAIASRDPAKACSVASQYVCRAMDYQTLVADPDIDLVYVPLPTGLHAEWVAKCLHAGKHVLCEKSLASTLPEVEALVAIARQKGLLLIENFQFRFHSQHQMIRAILDSGKLGEIRCFRSSFGFPPFQDPSDIRYSKALGGGALLDAGAYTLKSISVVLGEGFRVKAASRWQPADSEVDLGGGAYLENDAGVMVEVAFGFNHFYQCNYEIWGSKGHLIAKRAFTAPPGFTPEVVVHTAAGGETMELLPDDHFANMLTHCAISVETHSFEAEYRNCLTQSDLIQQTRERSLEPFPNPIIERNARDTICCKSSVGLKKIDE